ncbi:MAG: L-threonine 3-dehydrogenase [Phycisphaerales bacterium]
MASSTSTSLDPSDTASGDDALIGTARTMRALVKARKAEGLDLVADRPMPTGCHGVVGEPGPTEVLIRVKKAGVCGTDRHIYEWDEWAQGRIPTGIVTGHEFAGVVEAVGPGVERFKPGMRVSGEGHITKWEDFNSRTGNAHIARDTKIIGVDRDGSFADYLILPQSNVWPLHEDIPDEFGAVMDPLGNAVHTVMEAGVSAKSVLITGVGIIGLMSVSVARAAGASRIFVTDANPKRLELAKELGADVAFDAKTDDDIPEQIRAETRGEGVDVLLEMSGAPSAIDTGFESLRNGGTASLLGIPSRPLNFDITKHVIFKGAKVHGINGRRMWETWYQMETLLLANKLQLRKIITHELPMEDYKEAFRLMQSGEGIKVVLKMGG